MSLSKSSDVVGPDFQGFLAFYGAITASATHELNNVLATVDQVIGLVEDLAMSQTIQEAGVSEKLLSVVERIMKQSSRGTELIRQLNTFAHLGDSAATECNLGSLLGTIAALTERIAGMRKVQLTTAGLDHTVVVTCNALALAQVVFLCIKRALAVTAQKESIAIGLTPHDKGGRISFESSLSDNASMEPKGEDLMALIGELGAGLEETVNAGRLRITISIPSQAVEH